MGGKERKVATSITESLNQHTGPRLGHLSEMQIPGPIPRNSDLVGLREDPGTLLFNKHPGGSKCGMGGVYSEEFREV